MTPRRWLLALLLLATPVWAGDLTGHLVGTLGTLSACAVPPCAFPNTVSCDGAAAAYFEMVPGGNTIEIDEKLQGGTNFILVSGTSGSTNATFKVLAPAGKFQGNLTVFPGGSATINFQCVREQ